MTGKENRESIRVRISGKLVGVVDDFFLAHIKNLSTEGICFELEGKISIGTECSIAIKENDEKEVEAKILRSEQKGVDQFEVGAEFINRDPKYLNDVVAALQKIVS